MQCQPRVLVRVGISPLEPARQCGHLRLALFERDPVLESAENLKPNDVPGNQPILAAAQRRVGLRVHGQW